MLQLEMVKLCGHGLRGRAETPEGELADFPGQASLLISTSPDRREL